MTRRAGFLTCLDCTTPVPPRYRRCAECQRRHRNELARILQRKKRIARRSKLRCRRCGDLHGGDGRRRFCAACQIIRNRLYQRRYSATPKGKDRHYRYELVHGRERTARARQRRQARPPKVVRCATLLCENTVIRARPATRRKFCLECVRIFWGPAYANRRRDAA